MKKITCSLLLTILLLFTFSFSCFAAASPGGDVLPTKEQKTERGGGDGGHEVLPTKEENDPNGGGGSGDEDRSATSPKTGYDAFALASGMMIIMLASGAIYVSYKKIK